MGHSNRKDYLNNEDKSYTLVKWIGTPDRDVNVPKHLTRRNVQFYHRCLYKSLTLNIGDFVLISDTNDSQADDINDCDIGKILYMYQLKENFSGGKLETTTEHAIIQWYIRPISLKDKYYNDRICVDFDKELFEDCRFKNADIAIGDIVRKCSILYGTINCTAEELLRNCKVTPSTCPMYVCRYKLAKIKNMYQLVPIKFHEERDSSNEGDLIPVQGGTTSVGNALSNNVSGHNKNNNKELWKHRSSSMNVHSIELSDTENNSSPENFLNKHTVTRLSANKEKIRNYNCSDNSYKSPLLASPLAESNIKITPKALSSIKARRNLNDSLEIAASTNTTGDSDYLNYSIVNTSPSKALENELKLKLRISQRQRSKRLIQPESDTDPLAISDIKQPNDGNLYDLYKSPTKKLKENIFDECNNMRKSILKSSNFTRDSGFGTPKRKVQLSKIVQKHVYMNSPNEQLTHTDECSQSTNNNVDIEMYTPTKSLQNTPNKTRKSSIINHDNNNDNNDNNDPRYELQTPKSNKRKTPSQTSFNNEHEQTQTPEMKHQLRRSTRRSMTFNDNDNYNDNDNNIRSENIEECFTPIQKTPSKRRQSSVSNPNTPRTPREKLKMLRSGELTPSIKQRVNVIGQGESTETDFDKIREYLHVSTVPQTLPCREKEFQDIYTYLVSKLKDKCGGCMYISGVPGTGKTATVTAVIRMLQQQSRNGNLPQFDYLDINGMRLTEPRQAYVQIYRQITGKTVAWETAYTLLEKRFTSSAGRRLTTVLLVDELDILCNRRQDVVYNLLDWPSKAASHLVVITIANTMDLPERVLRGKVTSRLGLTRLTFQPYTYKQLQQIVTERLQELSTFQNDAIQLVARKVAAVSGDARRALDICRRATEIASTMNGDGDITGDFASTSKTAVKCVNMLHVQEALKEMIASAKVQAIKNCSRFEKIFLQATVAEYQRTGVEEMSFMGIYAQFETLTSIMGVRTLTPGEALNICHKLSSARLIIGEHSRYDLFQKILLNVSTDEMHYALKLTNGLL